MHILKKLFFLFLFSSISNLTFAQNFNLGFSLNLGASKITSNNTTFSIIHRIDPSPLPKFNYTKSGSVGFFIEKNIVPSLAIGSELLWVQIEGKENLTGFLTETRFHQSFLALPLYTSFVLKKLKIKAGVQPMALVMERYNTYRFSSTFSNPIPAEYNFDMDRLNFGYKFGLEYSLFNHLSLRADFFSFSTSDDSFEQKSIQGTLGLNYIFLKK